MVSNSQKGRYSHSSRSKTITEFQAEMAVRCNPISSHVIQTATAVMMMMREVQKGPAPCMNAVSSGETDRQKHGGPAMRQPSFNWSAINKYIELFSFRVKVTNILWTKTYELTEEEKVSILKNWLGR